MKISNTLYIYGGAAAAGLALIWWATRAGNAAKLAQGATRVAGEVATGVVKGVGQAVGVPDTDQTQCQRDLADGKLWAASFSCPAGDYVAGLAGKTKAAVFGSTAVQAASVADTEATTDQGIVDYANYSLY